MYLFPVWSALLFLPFPPALDGGEVVMAILVVVVMTLVVGMLHVVMIMVVIVKLVRWWC